MFPEPRYTQCPDQRIFLIPKDADVINFNFIWNEINGDIHVYDDEDCPVRPGNIVIDVGSNMGIFALRAIEQFGAARVVCIEAEPVNAKYIQMNLANFQVSEKAIILNKAAYSHNDGVKLNVVHNYPGWHFVAEIHPENACEDQEIDIPSTTIDSLVRELNLPRVDFMKFDIEGAEIPALSGAEETIRNLRPNMVIAVYHKPEDPVEIEKLVKKYQPDYQTKLVDKGPWDKVLFCW